MKKGISLIVLVITIIVMIIIAGAIIISLSQTNVMDQANTATFKSNDAEARSLVALVYASNLFTASGNGASAEYVRKPAADLEDLINDQLEKEFNANYKVEIDPDDYSVEYKFPKAEEKLS